MPAKPPFSRITSSEPQKLEYSSDLRFGPKEPLPESAKDAISHLASRIADAAPNPQNVIENFKGRLGARTRSTSYSWAETDLKRAMNEFEGTQAAFVECIWLAITDCAIEGLPVPDTARLNEILIASGLAFEVEPPHLRLLAAQSPPRTAGALAGSFDEVGTPAEDVPFRNIDAVVQAIAETLSAKGRPNDARLIASARPELEYETHDNWNGGTSVWGLLLHVPFADYQARTTEERSAIEQLANDAINAFLPERGHWCSAKLKAAPTHDPNWRAVFSEQVGASNRADSIRSPSPGAFRVGERLGAGAYGATYRAEQVALKRPVALKWLNPSAPSALEARKQAQALARLDHDNVVVVHDVVRLPNPRTKEMSDCIVMQLIEGATLSEALQGGVATPEQMLEAGRGIIAGIKHIHGLGLAHGDLHGDNVLLRTSDRRAILIDLQYWSSSSTVTIQSRSIDLVRDVRKLRAMLHDILLLVADLDAARAFDNDTRQLDDVDQVALAYGRYAGRPR